MNGQSNSAMEMGLSSMVSLLQVIATENVKSNTFLDSIKTDVKATFDSVKDIFNVNINKKLERYRNAREKREQRTSQNIQTITDIMLDQVHKPEMVMRNKAKEVGKEIVSNITKAKNNLNLYINNKIDSVGLKHLDGFMSKLADFVKTDSSKLDAIGNFFERLNTQIDLMGKKGYKAGLALAFITTSLVILQYVTWSNIAKMAVVLVTVGIGFAFFFKSIVGAVANANFFKSVSIMLFMPDVLLALGKAVLLFSISMFIFNYVGYEALLKFAMALTTLALVWKLGFDSKGIGKFAWSLISLSISVLIFTYALIKLNKVEWSSLFMMIGFIIGLSTALRISNWITGTGRNNNPLTSLSLGLVLLVVALSFAGNIAWQSAFVIIAFVTSLTASLKLFGGGRGPSGVISFAFGLGILVLSLAAVGELNWSTIGILTVWIIGFALALRIATFGGNSKTSGIFGFALGMGLLILALDAVGELQWDRIIKLSVWIIAISTAIRIANGGGKSGTMIWFAIGLGLMVLAMDAMSELSTETLVSTIAFIGGLGLAMRLFPQKLMFNMLILSASIWAVTLAIKYINDTDWNFGNVLKFAGMFVIIGALFAGLGYGPVAGLVAIGAAVGILLSLAIFTITTSLFAVSKLNVSWGSLWDFMKSVAMLSLTFAILAPVIIMAVISSMMFLPVALTSLLITGVLVTLSKLNINDEVITKFGFAIFKISMTFLSIAPIIAFASLAAIAFLPVGIASYLAAVTLMKISNININTETINKFSEGLKTLISSWNTISLISVAKAAIKATSMLPVLIASFLSTKVIAKISNIKINEENVNKFGSSLTTIIKVFDRFGVIQSGKLALKATALLPVIGIAWLAAKSIEKINNVDIKPEKVDMFLNTMNYLVDNVLVSLSDNEDKLKKAKPGIEALGKLLGTFKSLGDVIQLMAQMKFYEMGVSQDGRLVYKSVRELKPSDLQRFSQNIGTLISTLISPLSILGSKADILIIGGKKIQNPFKNKQTLNGIEIIGKLSNAYKPLAESIIGLTQSGALSDQKKTTDLVNGLTQVFAVYLWFFNKTEKLNPKTITNVMDLIKSFNDSVNNLRVKHIKDLNDIFESFMNKLTDDLKWRKIERNLISMKKHFKELSTIINSVNIQKADKFEKVVKALTDRQNGKGLVEAAQALRDILEQVNTNYIKQQELLTKQIEAVNQTATTLKTTTTPTQTTFGIGTGVISTPQQQVQVQQVPAQQSTPPQGYLMTAKEHELFTFLKKLLDSLNSGIILGN